MKDTFFPDFFEAQAATTKNIQKDEYLRIRLICTFKINKFKIQFKYEQKYSILSYLRD